MIPPFDYRDTIARHRLDLGDEQPPLATFVEDVVCDLGSEQNDALTAAKAEAERWVGWTESELRFAHGDR